MKRLVWAGAALALHASTAGATEIVYTPVNPSFGGNPQNGPILLNQANAINKYQDPAVTDALNRLNNQTPLEQINQQMESLVAQSLANQALTGLIDTSVPNKPTFKPGTLDTANFIFTVATNPNGFTITTFDKLKGTTSNFIITSP
jgi:curli production assembly/transport component CsgF